MEPQWNPMVEDQALDRVYRIGQMKEVTTVRYIIENTLEEVRRRYLSSVENRARLICGQSIRDQQLGKRNLAEQALSLSKRSNEWVKVSGDDCTSVALTNPCFSDQRVRAMLSNTP